jgi:hypothetical protein
MKMLKKGWKELLKPQIIKVENLAVARFETVLRLS